MREHLTNNTPLPILLIHTGHPLVNKIHRILELEEVLHVISSRCLIIDEET